MSDVVYTSNVRIERSGPLRTAYPAGETQPLRFSVHGARPQPWHHADGQADVGVLDGLTRFQSVGDRDAGDGGKCQTKAEDDWPVST